MANANRKRSVSISVDERQWRGLRFEARLLSGVFGRTVTPEEVAQARLDSSLSRVVGPTRRTSR